MDGDSVCPVLAVAAGWTNRYKESFTFDDVANALMQTPLHRVSCGGAHLLDAMTVLLRANASTACLSESVREALTLYLQRQTSLAVRSQTKEGYWTLDWYAMVEKKPEAGRVGTLDNQHKRLLTTGHILEWLELLPMELQPAPQVYRRAARALCAALREGFRGNSSDRFCPLVHATCAVQGLIGEVRE